MREECRTESFGTRRVRITPAHAGRIYPSAGQRPDVGDHPRACGKNKRHQSPASNTPGSPPRMREECYKIIMGDMQIGITPAHAGRIDKTDKGEPPRQDHPRACGKNT